MFKGFWRFYREAETLSGIWGWAVTQAIITAIGTAATVALGFMEGLPLMFIWVAALLTSVLILTILLSVRDWRKGLSPSGDVFIGDVAVELQSKMLNSSDRLIDSVQLAIIMHNNTDRPIEYHVKSIRTTVDGRVNMAPGYHSLTGVIPSNGVRNFIDAAVPINITAPNSRGTLNAIVEGELDYNWVGGKKHILPFKKIVQITLEPNAFRSHAVDGNTTASNQSFQPLPNKPA